jgi:ABC-2 type transport system permease protein
MRRFLASIKKEVLLLVRDWAGLGLIFLMPAALVMVMTLIQDASFRKMDETRISLLYLDEDRDTLGLQVLEGLQKAGYFDVITQVEGKDLNEETLVEMVRLGRYQMGIIIRKNSSEAIRERGQRIVEQTILHLADSSELTNHAPATITLYFDPAMKASFKVTVRATLENFTSKIEAGILYNSLSAELAQYLPEPPGPLDDPGGGIVYEEIYAKDQYTEIIPNSVQHNVPAWTIFAMFFIIIPLTGNMIKEREAGLARRLQMMPGSRIHHLGAKVLVFLGVGLVQFALMLLIGKLLFPRLDLPPLTLGDHPLSLILMAVATVLAATGYSVLVGSLAKTHDQAAVFGVVSVIVMAALGGIWVPVFMMPQIMQTASMFSPLNWSLEGFYNILLRGSGIGGILPNLASLTIFFIINLTLAIYFNIKSIKR